MFKSASKSTFIILARCYYFYKESSSLFELERLWGRKIILPDPELFFLFKLWSLFPVFRPIATYTLFYLPPLSFLVELEFVLLESSVVWSNVLLIGIALTGSCVSEALFLATRLFSKWDQILLSLLKCKTRLS